MDVSSKYERHTFQVEQRVVVRVSLQDGAEEGRTSSENHLGSQILAREIISEKVYLKYFDKKSFDLGNRKCLGSILTLARRITL